MDPIEICPGLELIHVEPPPDDDDSDEDDVKVEHVKTNKPLGVPLRRQKMIVSGIPAFGYRVNFFAVFIMDEKTYEIHFSLALGDTYVFLSHIMSDHGIEKFPSNVVLLLGKNEDGSLAIRIFYGPKTTILTDFGGDCYQSSVDALDALMCRSLVGTMKPTEAMKHEWRFSVPKGTRMKEQMVVEYCVPDMCCTVPVTDLMKVVVTFTYRDSDRVKVLEGTYSRQTPEKTCELAIVVA
jgi:hypothetical protein